MKSLAGIHFKRIFPAVAVSLLLHILLLWQWPEPELASKINAPSLQAMLAAPTRPAKKTLRHPPPAKPSLQPQAKTVPSASAIPATTNNAASAVAAETAVAVTGIPEVLTAGVNRPLLPGHAQLTFSVQYGNGGFEVGGIIHILEIKNGQYSLLAETQTTGLASLFRHFYLRQMSSGLVTQEGLRPENYREDKIDGSGKQISSARFDWGHNKIFFANGSSKPLLQQAQDILSLSYQLSQMPLSLDTFPIALSNGRNFSQYFIAVGAETVLDTEIGELRTIPLRKVQSPNEDGLIIWLALEYRLLPVKIQYLDKSGAVSANMLITDIRVSDE